MATMNKASFIGFLPLQTRMDVASLSPQSRYREVAFDLPAVTQNTQTFATLRAVPFAQALVSGYVVFRTAPIVAGGTCTLLVEYLASDGSTSTTLVSAVTVLSKSDRIPFALTVASTSTWTVGGSIRVSLTTSNNAVGTQQVGGTMVLVTQPVEDSVISD